MIGPLWGEKDEEKRIDGWKAVDKFIAENALVIPLLQFVQPILSAPGVVVTPHSSGALLPASDETGLRPRLEPRADRGFHTPGPPWDI
jgi:hypothetical protein